MKIAVVWNSHPDYVPVRLGRPCPEAYQESAVRAVADALLDGGFDVRVVQGDVRLVAHLQDFFGQDIDSAYRGCMVFNMAYGIQGDSRYTHVPAMLEMAGIPYTGSGPLGHALALDKAITKILIESAGWPTPAWMVTSDPSRDPSRLRFPLIVKPRHESTSFGLQLARDRAELAEAISHVVRNYLQDALVEEYIEGREVCVGILGNDPARCLPLVEIIYGDRALHLYTREDKGHMRPDELAKRCPASLPEPLAGRLWEMALGTYAAVHCKDFARVDIRIDPSGNPYVLEINSMTSLSCGSSFVNAAFTAGHSMPSLVREIVETAQKRYAAGAALRSCMRI